MMDERTFLENIRARLGKRVETEVEPSPGSQGLRPANVKDGADTAALFLSEWRAVGGEGELVSEATLTQAVLKQARRREAQSIITWGSTEGHVGEGVYHALASEGFSVKSSDSLPSKQLREVCSRASVGVVWAWKAIASTGTVVVQGLPGRERMVGILPPALFTIVQNSHIEPALSDVLLVLSRQRKEGRLPQNVSFITGPSKSADIGLELVTNVHGPGDVYAFVVAGR